MCAKLAELIKVIIFAVFIEEFEQIEKKWKMVQKLRFFCLKHY